MADIVPVIALHNLLNELRNPSSLFDQDFGLGVLNDDLVHPRAYAPLHAGYYRPWRHQSLRHSGVSNINSGKAGFKVNLDVQQFKAEEVSVKIVDDFVVVEGKHEERQDEHGFISRQFQRRYHLPQDVDAEQLTCSLSSDGVLTITAPKKELTPPQPNERVIQIVQTQQPALKHINPQASGKGDSTEGQEQAQNQAPPMEQ